ncbi:hypothetical protein Javan306_0033 [Streptococcus phage Javan306]|uniref:DUF1642 domain-containing protein n=1 Tax=Streptococcus mitis TaxID=28037 RepID=UPI00098AA2CD|nr:DUF1642 domain-containing protein [Streptococcus mitis]QBX26151.1 hypothetical protein Javan306_0033 [Streptococcus phage Javan306]
MNKQELIEGIEAVPAHNTRTRPWIDKRVVLGLIKQLDEPEKVKVPQFVAEYIEFKKKNNFHVYGAMRVIEDHYDKKVPDWFYEGNIEKFCLAWLLGYEVEEEKRCRVKIKGTSQYLRKDETSIFFSSFFISDFTRNDIEDLGFGWVFDCPGIEIEEVEG